MSKYCIRFNKSRGQPGRGSEDHVWRVFCEEQEYLIKDLLIQVPSWSEKSDGPDWNICCRGILRINNDIGIISTD